MGMPKTYGEFLTDTLHFLKPHYTMDDLRFLLMRYKKWNLTQFLNHKDETIPEAEQEWLVQCAWRLNEHYPLQYLLGYELFFDREFVVNEHTLIPRPETEWLVDYLLANEQNENLKVADIGTGSGVIGITLKLERPKWDVTITDIKEDTLNVALENAKNYAVNVTSKLGDNLGALDGQYDLIVSNPPYIAKNEIHLMDKSVLEYEPKEALFADNNGLAFYEKFSRLLPKYLKPNGRVYLEIGFEQGIAVKRLLQKRFQNKEITIHKDYNGNERLIVMK